jgi:hypothetical protein
MLKMEGKVTASPMPMAMRVASRTPRPRKAAGGVSTVNSDQNRTPAARTILPPKRSASRPPTTCSSR